MASGAHHEQHRVLSIRGKSYCNSACVFCIERVDHPSSPKVDEVRRFVLAGRGKYNMLFFMAGEPSLHPKLFEHVALAKANGYRYFGMSSHFRAFADPRRALKILEAGFTFFDISLHASTRETQAEVNPIGDGGESLKEALHGLRNVMELARRTGRQVGVTHKIVITRLNVSALHDVFDLTYRLGVRSYILQPVRTSALGGALVERLAINEDEFMPHVNELLHRTEDSGAEIKLYGMSRIGAYEGRNLVGEANVVRHATGKRKGPLHLTLYGDDRIVPERLAPSDAPTHQVTVQLPTTGESVSFECAEDQFILDAALASGLGLPFGCRMASCGQCCGRVIEGSVRVDEGQLVLTDDQLASGFVVLCRSSPRSDAVILTHQESELGI
jgi:ferredoxin